MSKIPNMAHLLWNKPSHCANMMWNTHVGCFVDGLWIWNSKHGQSLECMWKKVASVKLWRTPNVLQKLISTLCVPNKNLAKHSFLVSNCCDFLFEWVLKTTLDKQLWASVSLSFQLHFGQKLFPHESCGGLLSTTNKALF